MTQIGRRALVCSWLPRFEHDSGSRSIRDLTIWFKHEGWQLSLLCDVPPDEDRYVRAFRQLGIAVYNERTTSLAALLARGQFEAVILCRWGVAEPKIPLLRRLSPHSRIIVQCLDLHFLREARDCFTGTSECGMRRLRLEHGERFVRELNTYSQADLLFSVSDKEAKLLADLLNNKVPVLVLPISDEIERSTIPFEERTGIVFVGSFSHRPNKIAVEYLIRKIVPELDTRLLEKNSIYIIGDGAGEALRRLMDDVPRVKYVGWVPSTLPYMQRAKLVVVPLLFGAGMKRKLVEALMAGTPVVSTSIGIEGLNLIDGADVLVADDPHRFAQCMGLLLTDSGLWQDIAQNSYEKILNLAGRETWRRHVEMAMATLPNRTNPLARY